MKKKGFTLVELLATIVVLSVIALIAVPIVINVIEKAKKSALVSSVNGLVESANMYYTNEIIKGDISDNVIFDFEEGIQTSDNKLSYKGKVYNGKLILTSDSEVITCIDDGKYYAYKEKNSDEIVSGIGTCLYDGTTGDFTIESDIDVIQKECASDKKELQDRIDELTDNVNNLETLINEKEYEISNLNSTIEGLNNELDTIRGEKEELQNQLALSNTSNSELQEKINELNGTIATLESSIEAKDNEITVLNGEKVDLQTALDNKTAELAKLNENLGKVTATASDVLSGKTILTSSGLVTGSMANNGSISQTLNAGGSYTIPKGYHDGTGKVTANTLASQTSATAVASNILSGKTAWVNGSKITGTMANKSGATVTASAVIIDGTYTYLTIPTNGYYNTSSKIRTTISNATVASTWSVNARSTDRSTSITYTAPANTSYYLLAYKTLSQFPTTSSSVMTATNATKINSFNINTTQNNASFDVLNLYKITDRSQTATLTITSGGDYGSPGVMYLALGDISYFANLSLKGGGTTTGTIKVPANTAKYVVAYIALSQYYYSSGRTTMYPISNISVVSGSEIFYGQNDKPFVPVFAVYKIENENEEASFYINSTGDYGNKYVKYIYLG